MSEKKANIQWYPGHMTRAKRDMQESIGQVDMVIEIRDCRIPYSSKNPMIDQMIQSKPRLIVLSKKDKGEKELVDQWIKKLSNETTRVVALDLIHDKAASIITNECLAIMKPKREKQKARGINPRSVRAMVVGIPNVGKSTLINQIAKKKIAETSDRPGVTRALKWVKLSKDLDLLDTPGVLWPKFEDERVAMNLAITGAINDNILPIEEVALYAMKTMIATHSDRLAQRYQIEIDQDPYVMFERIAQIRKFTMTNGEMDTKRNYESFLRDIRDDKFGPITWEAADEM